MCESDYGSSHENSDYSAGEQARRALAHGKFAASKKKFAREPDALRGVQHRMAPHLRHKHNVARFLRTLQGRPGASAWC